MNSNRIRDRLDFLWSMAQDLPGANRRGSGWQARLAAGLWIKNELIAVGWNQAKSDPFQAAWGKNGDAIYLHAEIHALKTALGRVGENSVRNGKTTLMIARSRRVPTEPGRRHHPHCWGIAKPCPGCWSAIQHFGIRSVIWTESGDPNQRRWTVQELA